MEGQAWSPGTPTCPSVSQRALDSIEIFESLPGRSQTSDGAVPSAFAASTSC
jgi:hypothetical protein